MQIEEEAGKCSINFHSWLTFYPKKKKGKEMRGKKGDTDIPKKEKVWTKTFISGRQNFNDVDTVTHD